MTGGYCSREQLGQFIVDLPDQLSINTTSIWSHRVIFPNHLAAAPVTSKDESSVGSNGFWDNPEGNPSLVDSEYASPWKRTPTPVYEGETATWSEGDFHIMATDDAAPPSATSVPSRASTSDNGVLHYKDPITYPVPKTGYYCVAIIPLTVMDLRRDEARDSTDVPNHPKYSGSILFRNTFNGQLPAAEYPKVNVIIPPF